MDVFFHFIFSWEKGLFAMQNVVTTRLLYLVFFKPDTVYYNFSIYCLHIPSPTMLSVALIILPVLQELLLRVQHILQRAYRAELSRTKPAPLQLGERCVDLNDAIVTLPEGKTLALTATELALLRKLAENRGHIVTYDALCAAVWGADYYGYENSLGVHIRHLREKLEAEPGAPQFLRTVRGIGYKLTKGEEA